MIEYLFETVIISLEINQNNIWRVIQNQSNIEGWNEKKKQI